MSGLPHPSRVDASTNGAWTAMLNSLGLDMDMLAGFAKGALSSSSGDIVSEDGFPKTSLISELIDLFSKVRSSSDSSTIEAISGFGMKLARRQKFRRALRKEHGLSYEDAALLTFTVSSSAVKDFSGALGGLDVASALKQTRESISSMPANIIELVSSITS